MACRGKKEEHNAVLTHRALDKENRKAQGNVMAERKEEKNLSPDPSPQERGGSAKQREEDGCRGHNNGGNDDGS